MRIVIFLTLLFSFVKANVLEVNILYLEQKVKRPPTLSNVIEEPKDSALKGIQLAIKDSNKVKFRAPHSQLLHLIIQLNVKYYFILLLAFHKMK